MECSFTVYFVYVCMEEHWNIEMEKKLQHKKWTPIETLIEQEMHQTDDSLNMFIALKREKNKSSNYSVFNRVLNKLALNIVNGMRKSRRTSI